MWVKLEYGNCDLYYTGFSIQRTSGKDNLVQLQRDVALMLSVWCGAVAGEFIGNAVESCYMSHDLEPQLPGIFDSIRCHLKSQK